MITLEAADLIEGDASAASVVDFTINGVEEASNVVAIKALADGQLAAAKGTLYTTPASTETIVKSITLVNTDASARTVNLYIQRDGSNSRRIIPEGLSLEANGGSAVLSSDGLQVFTAAGALLSSTTAVGHALLDGSVHTDTAADAVTRGSIVYGNATPAWDELVKGAADTFLGSDGTDISYRTAAQVLASLSGDAGAAFDWNDQILQKVMGLLITTATELTMDTNGAITVTQMVHTVDTFEDAASDDLVTINGGTTVGLIIIRPAHTDRTVVVKDGGGNIELLGGADITLDDITDHVMLFWDTTNSKWVDIGGGGGGAAGANTALSNLASVAINTSLISDTDDTDDLGSAAKQWKDLYIDGVAYIDEFGEPLVSDTDNTDDLGSDAVRWKDLFLSGAIECLGGLWDDDRDTGIQVEEGADDDHFRVDTGGTEVMLIHDSGIIDYVKQSGAKAYLGVLDQTAPTASYIRVCLDTETYDIQNEFDSTVKTGAADGTVANHLQDDTNSQFTAGDVGAYVWNTTDNTYAKVTVFNDVGDVTIDTDIFVNGENYRLYRAKFTATEAGKYIVTIAARILLVDDQNQTLVALRKNDTSWELLYELYMSKNGISPYLSATAVVSLAANDYLRTIVYQDSGANKDIDFAELSTYMVVFKIA